MEYAGLYQATVVDNKDPKKKKRVRLKVPQVTGNSVTTWARPIPGEPVQAPKVGSVIWAGFEGGDTSYPIYFLFELPAGGSAGQFLVKKSGKDYDVEWIDQPCCPCSHG